METPPPADSFYRTGRVHLRPIEPSDLEALYRLSIDPRVGLTWRFRGSTPSFEIFRDTLFDNVLAQYVIETASGRLGGLAVCYAANMRNGFAYVGIVAAPDFLGTGLAIEGTALFLTYLFSHWNFRKLYAEVPAFNLQQFESAIGKYCQVEGLLLDHEYFAEEWWDLHILAFHRDACLPLLKDFIARANRQPSLDEDLPIPPTDRLVLD